VALLVALLTALAAIWIPRLLSAGA